MITLIKNIKLPYKRIILLFFAVMFCLNLNINNANAMDGMGSGMYTPQWGDDGSFTTGATEQHKSAMENASKGCDSPDKIRNRFLASCFICDVVVSLTREFVNVGEYTYSMVQELAYQILTIGLILWIPFYIMKQVSSFVAVEPSTMVKDLSIIFFKVGVAYCFIFGADIVAIIDFFITPFIRIGLDYGQGMMNFILTSEDVATIDELSKQNSQYYNTGGIMPSDLTFAMLKFLNYLHYTITNHLVIGNSLMCYSTGAGAIKFKGVVKIIDFWVFLSGLLIYIIGVMILIAAGYYFLDVSYKIGFVAMFMPVFIALWPFNMTKKYLTKAMGTIFMAAAIFAFFAILVCLSLSMVTQSIGELNPIVEAIKNDKAELIKSKFEGTSVWFLILAFGLLMSFQMIGKCKAFAEDFFSDGIFGGASSNDFMGDRMKRVTEMGYKAAKKPLDYAGDVAKTQGKKGLKNLGGKISSSFKSGGKAAGKAAGQATEKGIQAGGKAIGTGAGAAAGSLVDLATLGATGGAGAKTGAKIGGKAGEVAGKAVGKAAGKAVEKGVEKGAEAAGKVVEKGAETAGDAADEAGKAVKGPKKDEG